MKLLLFFSAIGIIAIIGIFIAQTGIDQSQQISLAPSEIVPLENARIQAVSWLRIQTLRSPGLKSDTRWLSSVIDPNSLIVYDLSGDPLWYIFNIVNNSEHVGTITISGQKTLGGPLYDFNTNRNSFIENDQLVPARNILMRDFPGDDVHSLRYVWDDYSGLLIEGLLLNTTSQQEHRILFDAYALFILYDSSSKNTGGRNFTNTSRKLTDVQQTAMISQWEQGNHASEALLAFAQKEVINLSAPLTSYQAFKIQEFLIENSIDTSTQLPPKIPFALISPIQTGRPCKSNEEWHTKADQIGSWIDGILVDESVSDSEITSFLVKHNISSSITMKSSPPHHIGYYLAVPGSQYQSFRDSVENNELRWNMSFSSPSYVFVLPSVKKTGEIIQTPVFIFNSDGMNESENFKDFIERNIPIQKTKIITFDLSQSYSPIDREKKLKELNDDDRILFVFKEYLEGDIC